MNTCRFVSQFTWCAFAWLALSGVLVSGCKDDAPKATPSGSASAVASVSAAPVVSVSAPAASASAAEEPKRPVMRGSGPFAMLAFAAKGLELSDEQKTKVGAAEGQVPDGPAALDARKQFTQELVTQVKAGKIENSKLEPHYAAVVKAQKERHDKEAAALNALYAALEPAQRTAAVAAVRAKQPPEHSDKGDAGKSEHATGQYRMEKMSFDRLTKDLGLDAAQQKKVDALAPKEGAPDNGDFAERRKQLDATLVAFEKAGFDATKLPPPDAKKLRAPFEREVALLTQLLAILKPDQQPKLAANFERQSGPRPGFPPHRRGQGEHARPGHNGGPDKEEP